MEQSTDNNKFCQATSCFFYAKSEEEPVLEKGGSEYIPEKGINLVKWDLGNDHTIVPRSLWKFDDPRDASRLYLASFGSADISDRVGRFQVKVVGRLWSFKKDIPEDPDEALISSGRTAALLIAGQDGTYDTAAAFVCYTKN